MPKYDKLVRDKIPEIIASAGKECVTRTLNEEEYKKYVFLKLMEEAKEANESMTLEELADLEEVVLAATSSLGYSRNDLEAARIKKVNSNGGFEKKILLEEVK
jgi:predicted house-cleaning noncanonical NTP pyrophosphatase (MazG superfamily)